MSKEDKNPSSGQRTEDIVKQYVKEHFTKEMLLSGDETWYLSAHAWLDEHYPDISDNVRKAFDMTLDQQYLQSIVSALGDEHKDKSPESEEPVFEGMTKSELLAKIKELVKSQDFLEARRLMEVYKG